MKLRSSLTIAKGIKISQGTIRNLYRLVHSKRMGLLLPEILSSRFISYMDGILVYLPHPNLENGITIFEERKGREDRTTKRSPQRSAIFTKQWEVRILVEDLVVVIDSKGKFWELVHLAPTKQPDASWWPVSLWIVCGV